MQEKGLTIKVSVKIEGLSELEEFPVSLPAGSQLGDLLETLVATYGAKVYPYLYNTQTGELGVFMAIVNDEMVRLPQKLDRKLADGDEVFIITPLGGG